jgi:hypothetical protein
VLRDVRLRGLLWCCVVQDVYLMAL